MSASGRGGTLSMNQTLRDAESGFPLNDGQGRSIQLVA